MAVAQLPDDTAGSKTELRIAKSLRVFWQPGEVREIRILNAGRSQTVSGYFDDPAKAAAALKAWDGKAPAIYFTLNPVEPALLARASNRLKERARETTQDTQISRRHWLGIDFDPVRPSGIASTDEEHEAAISRAQEARAFLAMQGWSMPVLADSGNGAHLVYRIDLAPNDAARVLIENVLKALAFHLADEKVDVDVKVANAARIWKVYGTLSRKGDDTNERPHRRARILEVPDELKIVHVDRLEAVAKMLPEAPAQEPTTKRGQTLDIGQWLQEKGIPIASSGPWNGGTKWVLDTCPWNPDHTNRSAFVIQFPSGAVTAGCHHNGCQGKGWRELRALFGEKAPEVRSTQPKGQLLPEPIPETEIEPFEPETLPGPVRRYVEEAAESLGAPMEFIAAGCLASLSVAIGNAREVVIKPDWREPALIWVVVVGPTGAKKSPSFAKALSPIWQAEDDMERRHKDLLAEWEVRHADWEREFAAWNKATKRGEHAGEKPPEPERPTRQQVVISDTTLEALADILQTNPRGVLLFRDELVGWVRDMARYREGGDRQHFLSMWSRAPVIINRRNRPDPLYLPRPFLSVLGAVPSDMLRDLADQEGREDGFLHRPLYVMVPDTQDRFSETVISPEAREGYTNLVQRLFALRPATGPTGEALPVPVRFSPEAMELWREWYADHARIMADPDLPPSMRGPEAKMPAQVARLALILYQARLAAGETAAEELDRRSLAMAAQLSVYFRSTANAVFGSVLGSEESKRVKTALTWIRKKDPDCQGVTQRDVLRARVAGCESVDDVKALFHDLERRGYGEVEREEAGGWIRLRFIPSPKVSKVSRDTLGGQSTPLTQ